jgi:hypothetical protein
LLAALPWILSLLAGLVFLAALTSPHGSSAVIEKKLLLEMADAWIHVGLAQADVFKAIRLLFRPA